MKLLPLLLLFFSLSLQAQTYYVNATKGDDSNKGTFKKPFKTLEKALQTLDKSIGTIYLEGGVYQIPNKIELANNGNPNQYIKIWAYNNEKVTIDSKGNTTDGIRISGSYYHLKGIEIMNAGHCGIYISGDNNIVENCAVHHNANTGLHMTGGKEGTKNPSNNLILNCDAYLNADLPAGANADGFAAKWNVGSGNVFRGCRAWNNSDDGWDLWMCTGSILIDSCLAFRNGVDVWGTGIEKGNGNGIKLGGNKIATPHTTTNSIAFDNSGNTGKGFDENNNLAGQTLFNCVAFRNKSSNFAFYNDPLNIGRHNIKNCTSYFDIKPNVLKNTDQENNSWQNSSYKEPQSVDTTGVTAPRDSFGRLPKTLWRLLQK